MVASDAGEHNRIKLFLKGIISTGTGALVTLVFGFITIMVAVRHVTKEEMGIYLLLQVIVMMFVILGDLGLNISATKHIACADDSCKSNIVSTMVIFRLLSAIVIVVVFIACQGAIYSLFPHVSLRLVYFFIPLLCILELLSATGLALQQGYQAYRSIAIAQILMSIMNLFLVLIMVVYIHKGILGLVYARVIALAVALVYQTFVLPMRHRCVFDTALLREMFKFGFPLGLNNILYFVFTKFDALLLGAMLNPVGVAYYGTATRIPDASRRMFESFRTVYFPNMAELFVARKKQEAEALLNNSLRIVSFLTIFITLVSVLFRERIVVFLFTAQYLDCAPVLAVLMVALSIGLVGNILGTSLVSAGYPKLPVVINIADTSVNVLANLMLIPVMGVMGAACAALLARAVTNPLNVWFLKKSGINVMISEYLKPFAIFAVCLMIQLVVGSHNILFYLCIIGLYVVLSQLFSVVSLNEVRFILRELRLYPTDVAAAGD